MEPSSQTKQATFKIVHIYQQPRSAKVGSPKNLKESLGVLCAVFGKLWVATCANAFFSEKMKLNSLLKLKLDRVIRGEWRANVFTPLCYKIRFAYGSFGIWVGQHVGEMLVRAR
jgi:hypothetical protein